MNACIGIILFLLCIPPSHSCAADIHISAAASLKEVINELSDGFAKRNPGVKLFRNYGASGALAKQIENGAPADLFISANPEWMEYLKARSGVNERDIAVFAYNSLVFAGKPALRVNSLQDVVRLDRIAIGSPGSVPAGEYAMAAFRKAGLEKLLDKKLVMAKDVREAMMYAERGEVDGAFVYRTDARQTAKNTKILFAVPQESYPRVTYPMALTVSGSKKPEAAALFRFLQSSEAGTVLTRHGFIIR
jgi:molybdate transport system substrate-binding protein